MRGMDTLLHKIVQSLNIEIRTDLIEAIPRSILKFDLERSVLTLDELRLVTSRRSFKPEYVLPTKTVFVKKKLGSRLVQSLFALRKLASCLHSRLADFIFMQANIAMSMLGMKATFYQPRSSSLVLIRNVAHLDN